MASGVPSLNPLWACSNTIAKASDLDWASLWVAIRRQPARASAAASRIATCWVVGFGGGGGEGKEEKEEVRRKLKRCVMRRKGQTFGSLSAVQRLSSNSGTIS